MIYISMAEQMISDFLSSKSYSNGEKLLFLVLGREGIQYFTVSLVKQLWLKIISQQFFKTCCKVGIPTEFNSFGGREIPITLMEATFDYPYLKDETNGFEIISLPYEHDGRQFVRILARKYFYFLSALKK